MCDMRTSSRVYSDTWVMGKCSVHLAIRGSEMKWKATWRHYGLDV